MSLSAADEKLGRSLSDLLFLADAGDDETIYEVEVTFGNPRETRVLATVEHSIYQMASLPQVERIELVKRAQPLK